MLVSRETKPSTYKCLKTYKTVYVWSDDGWVYDTATKMRMKYFITDLGFFIKKESWSTIPSSMYTEELEISIISEKPLSWIETGEEFEEMYTERMM